MNSGDLARAAGVSVRALRHYHQIGVLPEPGRGDNGYREYGPEHLLRVLRIVRAANAGVPLRRIGDVLDSSSSAAVKDLIESLEEDLDRRIADLQAQRAVVQLMRAGDFDPNLPSELASLVRRNEHNEVDLSFRDLETDQGFLLLHLLGSPATTYLAEVGEILERLGAVTTVNDLMSRFGALSGRLLPESTQPLVQESTAVLGPVVAEVRRTMNLPVLSPSSLALLEHHRNVRLNPAQRTVLDQIAQALRP